MNGDDFGPRRAKPTYKISTTCTKRGYTSASSARRGNANNNARVRAYFCQRCKHWHVTTEKNR